MKTHIPFVTYRFYFASLSLIAVIASLVFIVTRDFNYGIDF